MIVPASIAYNQEGPALSLQIPQIEQFDRVDLVLISSHLIEILHCPFSSNENEDTAASRFCFNFLWQQPGCTNTCHKVAALVVLNNSSQAHQYLPGAGSIIGVCIIAAGWVRQYLPEAGSIIGTQSIEITLIHININITQGQQQQHLQTLAATLHTVSDTNQITMKTFTQRSGNIQTEMATFTSSSSSSSNSTL